MHSRDASNLAETAFIVPAGDDYRIRWFTPTVEVPFCGHATLASAAVLFEQAAIVRSLTPASCRLLDDRVELQGSVVFYLEGEIEY